MASEVKTNKISPSALTTVTLGDASDLFQLPASAEIDIASGATLDVNGTIDLTGATTTGFPAGGLTAASQWRLTTDYAGAGEDPIAANLEVADQDGYGSLGSAMTESSGVFTFPSTGFWLVIYNWTFQPSNYSNDCSCWIDATIDDGSNWVKQAKTWTSGGGASEIKKMSASATAIIDVTDVANVKVQFGWSINLNGGTRVTYGDSDMMETGFTFLRLADT